MSPGCRGHRPCTCAPHVAPFLKTAHHLFFFLGPQTASPAYRGSSKNRAPPSAFVTGAKILHHEK